MDVMSPSKDALGPFYSIDYWFYYIIMLCEGVRTEKQKGYVTKCHLLQYFLYTVQSNSKTCTGYKNTNYACLHDVNLPDNGYHVPACNLSTYSY